MNYQTYQRITGKMLELEEELKPKAEEIARRHANVNRSADINRFTSTSVEYEVWYRGDVDGYDFPAAWLFADNWEQLVDEDIAARKAAELLRAQRAQAASIAESEARERQTYARLKEKYENDCV